MREFSLKHIVEETGAIGGAVTEVAPVGNEAQRFYLDFLSAGKQGRMSYLENHLNLRFDPSGLLEPAARTMICLAFSYNFIQRRDVNLPQFASYALGKDYHRILRMRIENALNGLKMRSEGEWRVCVDSAPVMERYWAVASGLAHRCRNGMVSIDGWGQKVLLAEVLTTLPPEELLTEPDAPRVYIVPSEKELARCNDCGLCRQVCPSVAIATDGALTARRCLNYLTIEYRGEWGEEEKAIMGTDAGRNTLYGCELCQNVCPLNKDLPESPLTDLAPLPEMLAIKAEDIMTLTRGGFNRMFRDSAAGRTGLQSMRRNAKNINDLTTS